MVDPIKLLVCPFCSGQATLNEIPAHTHVFARFMPDHPGSWTIECDGPKCGAGLIRDSREDVVRAWNRRGVPENWIDV